jgi:hypothetical protein
MLALSASISASVFFFSTFLCKLVMPELLVYPWFVYVLAMLALEATRCLKPGFPRPGSCIYSELNVRERDGEWPTWLLLLKLPPPWVDAFEGGLSEDTCWGKYALYGDTPLELLGDTERISPPNHCCAWELSMRWRLGVGARMVGVAGMYSAEVDVFRGVDDVIPWALLAFWLKEPEALTRDERFAVKGMSSAGRAERASSAMRRW